MYNCIHHILPRIFQYMHFHVVHDYAHFLIFCHSFSYMAEPKVIFHIVFTSMHCKILPISKNMITFYTLINSLMNSMHLFYPPQPNNTFCFMIFYNSLLSFTRSCCKILPTNNFHNIHISSFWCVDIVEEAPHKYITPP